MIPFSLAWPLGLAPNDPPGHTALMKLDSRIVEIGDLELERMVNGLRVGVSQSYSGWSATGIPGVVWSPWDRCFVWVFQDAERFTLGGVNGGTLSGWTPPSNLNERPRVAADSTGRLLVAYDRSVSGTNMVQRVTQGLTGLTTLTVGSSNANFDVVFDGTKFVLVSLGNVVTGIVYNSDWTSITAQANISPSVLSNGSVEDVLMTNGAGRVIALARGYPTMVGTSIYSTDSGQSWTHSAVDGSNIAGWNAGVWSSRLQKFLAFGYDTGGVRKVWMTSDGTSWESGQQLTIRGHSSYDMGSLVAAARLKSVVDHKGVLFGLTDSLPTNCILFSLDGLEWFVVGNVPSSSDDYLVSGNGLISVGDTAALVSI